VSRAGSAVLDGLVRGFDLSEVTDALAGAEPARRDEVAAFLARVVDYGLVEPDVGAIAQPLASDWREAARGLTGPVQLEAFDDIADLITADPIHDTDEATGWPVKKEA
jgi:hypothetical protein